MAKAVQNGLLPNTCGVGISSVFRLNTSPGQCPLIKDMENIGGADWHCAGFTTEAPAYREAYEELKKKWKIVYQTPVRINSRTNNQFIFVVYDTRSKMGPITRAKHNSQFGWIGEE